MLDFIMTLAILLLWFTTWLFTDQEIAKIDKNALQLWKKWKDHILETIRLVA